MSMSIEGIVAMQACARIGRAAFGGLRRVPAQSLRDRIEGGSAVMVITADEQVARWQGPALKAIVDEAIALGGCDTSQGRDRLSPTGGTGRLDTARDRWLHEEIAAQGTTCEPEWVAPSIHCSCSTPAAPPASQRACSTRQAATCCTPH
jgi:acetyl-CoA synthetase